MVRRRSKLGLFEQKKLIEHFVAGTPARSAAELVGVNRKTAIDYYHRLREVITIQLNEVFPEHGEFEVDESYFGGVRKGRRGRGAAGKVPVFGILKRGGKVYAKIIPDASSTTLIRAIRSRIKPDSVVYTDSFRSYNVLDVSEFHHHRVNHSKTFVSKRGHHINGIENFWNQSKRVLRKYNGIPRKNFHLFLKECEFRFNYSPPSHLYKTLVSWMAIQ